MQTLNETLTRVMEANHNSQSLVSRPGEARVNAYVPNMPPRLSARHKQQLTEILSQTCALQKQYGKTQAELETLVEGFSWALAEYPIEHIVDAFRVYIRSASDIPAPADIISIIERRSRYVPPPDIETLKRYKARGIPLTAKDEERLAEG